ncbi:unnamed protein product [Amoebophrya sp. A120]|nr:unnamed protein product [Amoebophrya sp. A120]|eukprot:GSA120T00020109001.1
MNAGAGRFFEDSTAADGKAATVAAATSTWPFTAAVHYGDHRDATASKIGSGQDKQRKSTVGHASWTGMLNQKLLRLRHRLYSVADALRETRVDAQTLQQFLPAHQGGEKTSTRMLRNIKGDVLKQSKQEVGKEQMLQFSQDVLRLVRYFRKMRLLHEKDWKSSSTTSHKSGADDIIVEQTSYLGAASRGGVANGQQSEDLVDNEFRHFFPSEDSAPSLTTPKLLPASRGPPNNTPQSTPLLNPATTAAATVDGGDDFVQGDVTPFVLTPTPHPNLDDEQEFLLGPAAVSVADDVAAAAATMKAGAAPRFLPQGSGSSSESREPHDPRAGEQQMAEAGEEQDVNNNPSTQHADAHGDDFYHHELQLLADFVNSRNVLFQLVNLSERVVELYEPVIPRMQGNGTFLEDIDERLNRALLSIFRDIIKAKDLSLLKVVLYQQKLETEHRLPFSPQAPAAFGGFKYGDKENKFASIQTSLPFASPLHDVVEYGDVHLLRQLLVPEPQLSFPKKETVPEGAAAAAAPGLLAGTEGGKRTVAAAGATVCGTAGGNGDTTSMSMQRVLDCVSAVLPDPVGETNFDRQCSRASSAPALGGDDDLGGDFNYERQCSGRSRLSAASSVSDVAGLESANFSNSIWNRWAGSLDGTNTTGEWAASDVAIGTKDDEISLQPNKPAPKYKYPDLAPPVPAVTLTRKADERATYFLFAKKFFQQTNTHGETPLLQAARKADISQVRLLLEFFPVAALTQPDFDQQSILHLIARWDLEEAFANEITEIHARGKDTTDNPDHGPAFDVVLPGEWVPPEELVKLLKRRHEDEVKLLKRTQYFSCNMPPRQETPFPFHTGEREGAELQPHAFIGSDSAARDANNLLPYPPQQIRTSGNSFLSAATDGPTSKSDEVEERTTPAASRSSSFLQTGTNNDLSSEYSTPASATAGAGAGTFHPREFLLEKAKNSCTSASGNSLSKLNTSSLKDFPTPSTVCSVGSSGGPISPCSTSGAAASGQLLCRSKYHTPKAPLLPMAAINGSRVNTTSSTCTPELLYPDEADEMDTDHEYDDSSPLMDATLPPSVSEHDLAAMAGRSGNAGSTNVEQEQWPQGGVARTTTAEFQSDVREVERRIKKDYFTFVEKTDKLALLAEYVRLMQALMSRFPARVELHEQIGLLSASSHKQRASQRAATAGADTEWDKKKKRPALEKWVASVTRLEEEEHYSASVALRSPRASSSSSPSPTSSGNIKPFDHATPTAESRQRIAEFLALFTTSSVKFQMLKERREEELKKLRNRQTNWEHQQHFYFVNRSMTAPGDAKRRDEKVWVRNLPVGMPELRTQRTAVVEAYIRKNHLFFGMLLNMLANFEVNTVRPEEYRLDKEEVEEILDAIDHRGKNLCAYVKQMTEELNLQRLARATRQRGGSSCSSTALAARTNTNQRRGPGPACTCLSGLWSFLQQWVIRGDGFFENIDM